MFLCLFLHSKIPQPEKYRLSLLIKTALNGFPTFSDQKTTTLTGQELTTPLEQYVPSYLREVTRLGNSTAFF